MWQILAEIQEPKKGNSKSENTILELMIHYMNVNQNKNDKKIAKLNIDQHQYLISKDRKILLKWTGNCGKPKVP